MTAALTILVCCLGVLACIDAWQLKELANYVDYLPFKKSGLASNEDFRTAAAPPIHLRNRKMQINPNILNKVQVEDVLKNVVWPKSWPYSFEDFRSVDYTNDEPLDLASQYQYSQSLVFATETALIGLKPTVPIKRHFIFPKDKVAMKDHLRSHFFEGAKVLELFSCYESILPSMRLGPVVGVGWYGDEMKSNPQLDDYIEQDISTDPYLPLADNYFDFVVVPAMFQLIQRPREMFAEINRVLKPGGMAIFGVKLVYWSFLGWKQCRYYVETNYLEDIVALGSFFHYAKGFSKPVAFDLNYPDVSVVGRIKDVLFPDPRLDFYACVQATKTKDSPHGAEKVERVPQEEVIEGLKYRPRPSFDSTSTNRVGPFY